MRYVLKICGVCIFLAMVLFCVGVVRDRRELDQNVIRLHVVAASDGEMDQAVKLSVRDAVLRQVKNAMEEQPDADSAHSWLEEHLDGIAMAAKMALREAGCMENVLVTLQKECFDRRDYETFSLPAGVYDSLRIIIGEGEGRNWWCVVFPSLCFTGDRFEDASVGAGFSEPLTDALQGEKQLRFFFLDCLGWLQNYFSRE